MITSLVKKVALKCNIEIYLLITIIYDALAEILYRKLSLLTFVRKFAF